MNGAAAKDAIRFAHGADRTAQCVGKSSQALRAGDRRIGLSGIVLFIALHPDRRWRGCKAVELPIRLGMDAHEPQQRAHTAAFLIETVRRNTGRNLVACERTAHGNRPDQGKPPSNHREQLEARHARHVQVGKKNVWNFLANLCQCGEAIFSRTHAIPSSVSTDDNEVRIEGSSSTMRSLVFESGISHPT